MGTHWDIILWFLEHPELGWIPVLLYLAYELRGERGRIAQLDSKLVGSITVIRALARANEEVDQSAVDEYLVENGCEPDDFLTTSNRSTEADEDDESDE